MNDDGQQQVNNGGAAAASAVPPHAPAESLQTNYWTNNMGNGWTPERRARQAELIHNWCLWQRSTGRRTTQGKARVSRNGFKGGQRAEVRAISEALREQAALLRTTAASTVDGMQTASGRSRLKATDGG